MSNPDSRPLPEGWVTQYVTPVSLIPFIVCLGVIDRALELILKVQRAVQSMVLYQHESPGWTCQPVDTVSIALDRSISRESKHPLYRESGGKGYVKAIAKPIVQRTMHLPLTRILPRLVLPHPEAARSGMRSRATTPSPKYRNMIKRETVTLSHHTNRNPLISRRTHTDPTRLRLIRPRRLRKRGSEGSWISSSRKLRLPSIMDSRGCTASNSPCMASRQCTGSSR